nr:stalk domain-containing protein [Paenibacillus xylanexedens]
MKKIVYIAGGIIIGVVFSTTAGAFADSVKSVIGKKVTGEYTIVVNGNNLSEKGAVIDSRANVPARAISEALGADVQVSGKTISITTKESNSTGVETVTTSNAYETKSKAYLESMKNEYKTKILPPIVESRDQLEKWLEESKEQGNQLAVDGWKKQLDESEFEIAKYEAELNLIEAALKVADN